MLSRDEQEATQQGPGLNAKGNNEDLQDALEQIALAESRTDTHNGVGSSHIHTSEEGLEDVSFDTSQSISPLQSPTSSPYLTGLSSPPSSRAWDILQQAGSSALPISSNQDKWHPNNKVSIVSVPRSARTCSSRSSFTSNTRRPSTTQQVTFTPPELDSPHEWPTFEPSSFTSLSPGHWHLGSPAAPTTASKAATTSLQASRSPSWNNLPTATTSSPLPVPSKAPMGVWANGSPSLRPVKDATKTDSQSKRPSALSSSKPPVTTNTSTASSDEAMDDDLKYAIELSLAEERSRQAE
jgi:hypothetical protein